LADQLDAAVEVLLELGVVVAVPPGLEADDVLASAATYARSAGVRTVLATSDRDSFALIDDNTRMLRILNGGVDASPLLDPARLFLVTGVRPEQYLDFAALRGDASDNLPGVPGIGPKTAARLLAEFGTARAAFDDSAGGGSRCRAVLGAGVSRTLAAPGARAVWERNCAVMAMVSDAPLGGLDLAHGVGALPLAEESVRVTFARLELQVPSAVRALTGRSSGPEGQAPRPVEVEAAWRHAPRPATRFPPLHRKHRRPEPAYVQETLF
jgi:DNA polymerase-1